MSAFRTKEREACAVSLQGSYRPRRPRTSPLWRCLVAHFDEFLALYPERYEARLGYLRPVIQHVVEKFLACGDLTQGFARIRCPQCRQEYLLAFSCRGRGFCPSCHQKRVLLFGERISKRVAARVPHRHYVFAIPIMLRAYFRYNRSLLHLLCAAAERSLRDYLRVVLHAPAGVPAVVMAIHTFGDFLRFHPHLHALVADGLFEPDGSFRCAPSKMNLQPLEKLFAARLLAALRHKGLLTEERADRLRRWQHSGFHVHQGRALRPGCERALRNVANYIVRNAFAREKIQIVEGYNGRWESVVYRSTADAKTGRTAETFHPVDFIAMVTQHIPNHGAQMVRYYGWYSNKTRGKRRKRRLAEEDAALGDEQPPLSTPALRPAASATWRELIKRIWEVDPLLCPRCGTEMVKLAAIRDPVVITHILRHVHMWEEPPARGPPLGGTVYEPCYDDPPAAAESNDQASVAAVQVFPDYDQYDPGPVYD